MKANEIIIKVSPLTNKIYAGKTNKSGTEWLDKIEVTDVVLSAIAMHMDKGEDKIIEFRKGTLTWTPR